jgi:hypothetical protein
MTPQTERRAALRTTDKILIEALVESSSVLVLDPARLMQAVGRVAGGALLHDGAGRRSAPKGI